MKTLKVAAIQMNSGEDVGANLTRARRALRGAAAEGVQLAVLPENFACMARREADRVALAEEDGAGPLQDFLAAEAARSGMWIVGGTLPIKSDDPKRPYAAALVYDGSGRRAGRYDKVHLFDVRLPESEEAYRESRSTMPGSGALLVESPSPTAPARRTGSRCSAPGPSRTSATSSPPRRPARTRPSGAPTATASSSIPGAPSSPRPRAARPW